MKKNHLVLSVFLFLLSASILHPSANLYAQANRLALSSLPFTTTQGNPSPTIVIEAWDDTLASIDAAFNDTVFLSASSVTGLFSADRVNWQDTTIITLSSGSGIFYFKNSASGSFVITGSRPGLMSDTQAESVLEQGVNETASFIFFTPYQVPADDSSACTVVVIINDTFGFPIANELVTLQTARGDSDTVLDSAGGVREPADHGRSGQMHVLRKIGIRGPGHDNRGLRRKNDNARHK